MEKKKILKLDYHTIGDENVKIFYSTEDRIYFAEFSENAQAKTKEWFSRVVSSGNLKLSQGFPNGSITFRVGLNNDTSRRTVIPCVNVNKSSIPFFFDNEGVLQILNKDKNGYFPAIQHMDRLAEIYTEIVSIIKEEKQFSLANIISLDKTEEK